MERKRTIHASDAPPAAGPYSHAVAVNNLLFLSGQGPFAIDGSGPVRGSIEEQTRLTMENVGKVLNHAGATLDDIVKVTVFLKNMDDFPIFNHVYGGYFKNVPPARSCVGVARLPADIDVEIDVVATLPG